VVELELIGLNERNKFNRSVKIPLNDQPYAKNINLLFPIDKSGLYSDYYELTMRLRNPAGIITDTKNTNFAISPIQKLAHPIETFKQVLMDNPYFFNYALGQQYEGIGNLEKAEQYFEKCVTDNPDFAEGLVTLLNIENKLKKYSQALTVVENLKKFAKYTFEYHLIKGKALFGLDKFDLALEELLKANTIYNSDFQVLNLIGYTFFKLNDMEQALKAFDASLVLNGKQPAIEKISAEIKNKIQKNPPVQQAAEK
jgi:tetratricopeptide (TPR) repeat protein